jgi:sulfotransferase family protein
LYDGSPTRHRRDLIHQQSIRRLVKRSLPPSAYYFVRGVPGAFRTLAPWSPGRGRLLPDYLIIGALRSGTTSLHGWLGEHPFVVPTTKELRYFNVNHFRGTDWYRTHFPLERERDRFANEHGRPFLVGDATVTYMPNHWTPQRAAKLLPRAKIIACLRNPVDRAYSHYHIIRMHGNEPLESFEDAIAQEAERLRDHEKRVLAEPQFRSWPLHIWGYLRSSRYAEQLERWYEFFPREQILLLNFDRELTRTSQAALDAVHKHLGLPEYRNNDLPVLNMIGGPYEPLADETRARLIDYFRPHNRRLYDLTGIDFGWPA